MLTISFQNQMVLITGGTRGIGAALAQEVLACQGSVLVTGTGPTPPAWMADLPALAAGQMVRYAQIDFAAPDWGERFDQIVADSPDIDVLINNAGIAGGQDIQQLQVEDMRRMFEVNLVAPAVLVSRVAPAMARRGYGRIVNISSIAGVISIPGRTSYSATKSGLIGQTRACALDLAGSGILVNAVCPGFVATDMPRRTVGEAGLAAIGQRVPLGRVADPVDIVPPTLFLASRLNTYVTGQTLLVDGGYTIE